MPARPCWRPTRRRGEPRYLQRAATLAESVTGRLAALAGGLIWEHYRADWAVDWDYNRDDRSNIFRPWGYQTGHLTEWAKLLLMQWNGRRCPRRRRTAGSCRAHTSSSTRRWRTAGTRPHGGLVYGFGPRQTRSATATSTSGCRPRRLARRPRCWRSAPTTVAYWHWYDRIWGYAWQHFVDHDHGAWYRILAPDNRKLTDEKSPAGKVDYHTMGACYEVLRGLGV